MSEHTPTPWISEQLPRSEYVGERFVVRHCYKDSDGISWTQYACVCEGARAKDDSRFIADACNLYERMRDYLRGMKLAWQIKPGLNSYPEFVLDLLLRDIEAAEKEGA